MFTRLTLSVAVLLLALPLAAHGQSTYSHLKNVPYADIDGTELVLDIFAPIGKSNGLGLVYVVAGAGYSDTGKTNEWDEKQTVDIFCSRGYTVFAVKPGPITTYGVVELADHVQRAIVFAKSHGDQYKIDPGRVGLLGGSSGAHLVALATVSPSNENRVKAAGVFFLPTNLRDPTERRLDIEADDAQWDAIKKQAFPGGIGPSVTASESATRLDGSERQRQVWPSAPPMLIVHGTADPRIPEGSTKKLLNAMRDAGVAKDLIVKPAGGKPGVIIKAEITALADWFDRRLSQN
jgi:acetyl esterase/lipase